MKRLRIVSCHHHEMIRFGLMYLLFYWGIQRRRKCWNGKSKSLPIVLSKGTLTFWRIFLTITIPCSSNNTYSTGPIMLDQALELSKHPTYVLPCENFQRVPLGEYSETLWTTIYDREVMFRLKPVTKHCGYYHLDQCHYGKHHNAVSYRNVHGEILD